MNKPVNKIEKLIAELCPEGVEFKELGEVAQYSRQRIAAAELNNENYIGVDNLLPNKQGKTKSNYLPTMGNLTRFESGDVLLGNIRPYLKKIWRATHTGGTNGDVLVIQINGKEILQSEFLYYLLSSDDFFNFDMKFAKGAKMPRGNKSSILKFIIPIPPLAIQQEIVKILDTFTMLEAELEAELEARKKQYEHYREELLMVRDDVEWKTLGEVCDYVDYRGKTPKKTAKGIFLVTAKNIRRGYIDYNTSKEFISEDDYNMVMRRGFPEIGDVLITTEAPCGFVAQVDKKNIALAQRVIKYRSKDKSLSNSFLKHYLLGNHFQEKLDKTATGSTVKGIKGSKLHKLTIPIPHLAEQERIVKILDEFDALLNDISIGLPTELNARRRQYEYYRNKLLTFKPLEKDYAN
jgi:type I restriction enzyme, S subunit